MIHRLEDRLLFSTYTVNTTSNSLDPGVFILSLPEAVAQANAHPGSDTINFDPRVFEPGFQQVITLNGELNLTDKSGTTTITGPGASGLKISGNNLSRVFDIQPNVTATISGVAIADGYAGIGSDGRLDGGGIYNQGTLTLADSTVTGNLAGPTMIGDFPAAAASRGGGINSSGKLTVQNCLLSGNFAYGAGYNSNQNYTVDVVGFTGAGGAIYASGPLTITGSILTGNIAGGAFVSERGSGGLGVGGAIYAAGTLQISTSAISNNAAYGASGAMDFPGGNGNGGAIFSAVSATIVSSTVIDNNASGYGSYGGGIFATGALTITSSTVAGNVASSGGSGNYEPVIPEADGGGIYSAINSTTGVDTLTLNQSTVSGNSAVGGDSDYGEDPGSSVRGGGIFAQAVTINSSSITGNNATGGAGSDAFDDPYTPVAGAGGNAQGGGLWIGKSSSMTDFTIANNGLTSGIGGSAVDGTASGSGGNASGAGVFTAAPLKILDSTITGNTATANSSGGSYYRNYGPGAPPHIGPEGKDGVASGGGVFGPNSSLTIDNTIVSADHSGAAFNDISGTVVSTSSNNLVGVGGGLINGSHGNKTGITNPKLSPLGNNGGPTQTIVPLAGSLAIDSGSNSLIPSGLTTDQRGYARIFNSTVDIGADEYNAITITGYVFNDVNGDGVRQSGEPGLAGIQVFVDIGDTGAFQSGDPFATTNSAGTYSFVYSPPAGTTSLIVRETRPSADRRTEPAGVYPLGFYAIATNKAAVSNVNFGDSLTAQVTGAVFHDTNANGIQNSGEAGLSGWTVEVDALVKGAWQNDKYKLTTSSTGGYSIVLASGTYRFHDVLKSGLHSTIPSSGSIMLTLADGATDIGENFGNR